MAFRFPLASVLRLREIHEQREERLLTQILAQIVQLKETIVSLESQIVAAAASREIDLLGQMSAAELQAAYGLAASLKDRKQFTESQLAEFERLKDKQIKTYQAAHRDRELLSGMREEQRETFHREQGRQEQKALDDLFIARMLRR